jgi:hypothetical protein
VFSNVTRHPLNTPATTSLERRARSKVGSIARPIALTAYALPTLTFSAILVGRRSTPVAQDYFHRRLGVTTLCLSFRAKDLASLAIDTSLLSLYSCILLQIFATYRGIPGSTSGKCICITSANSFSVNSSARLIGAPRMRPSHASGIAVYDGSSGVARNRNLCG